MKKIITIALILCFITSLVGCTDAGIATNTENTSEVVSNQSTEDTLEDKALTEEVLFVNWIDGPRIRESIGKYESRVEYELSDYKEWYNYAKESDVLCAVSIKIVGTRWYPSDRSLPEDYPVQGEEESESDFSVRLKKYYAEKMFEILEEENITLLKYSYAYREHGANILDDYWDNFIIAITIEDLYRILDEPDGALYKWGVLLSPQLRYDYEEVIKEIGWDGEGSANDWIDDNRALVERELGPTYILQEVEVGEIVEVTSVH